MKKHSILLAALALLSAATFTSCKENIVYGKGSAISEKRNATGSDKIKLEMGADIDIQVEPGAANSVSVKAQPNLQKHIKTVVKDGALIIDTEGWIYSDGDVKITITTPSLKELQISGSSNAKIKGTIKEAEFTLGVGGSADISIEKMEVNKFIADLAGSSDLKILGGNAQAASYDIAGSGEITAFNFITKTADAEIAGSGDISIYVTEKLDADIAGSGDVNYKGHPQITSDIAGSGSVNDRN